MSIGVTPKYLEDVSLEGISQEHYLVLALDAARHLNWRVKYISESGIIAYTNDGPSSRKSKIEVRIIDGTAHLKSASVGTELTDKGRNKLVIDAFITAFYEVKGGTNVGDLDARYRALRDSSTFDDNDVLNVSPPPMERISGIGGIFKPTAGYFITPIIVDLNIILFIMMALSGVSLLSPDTDSLLRWGADFRPLTLSGQWWRLITNTFLHIGIIHLVMNMFALLYIGLMLEPYLGKARFLAAYFLTGLAASVTSLCWHELTVSAGASGAIFGMYGVFLALLTSSFIEKNTRKDLLVSIAIFVGYNLLGGMKSGVDNSAHIGGLISGMLIGYAFIPSLKKPGVKSTESVTILLLTVLFVISTIVVCKKIPNDIAKYDAILQPFFTNEELAMEVLNMPDTTAKEKLLYGLKDRGIYYWNENLKLVDEADKLNLPDVLRKKDKLLRQYCTLRIKNYELLYKGIDEGTGDYQAQIDDCNEKISAVIDSLKK